MSRNIVETNKEVVCTTLNILRAYGYLTDREINTDDKIENFYGDRHVVKTTIFQG